MASLFEDLKAGLQEAIEFEKGRISAWRHGKLAEATPQTQLEYRQGKQEE